MYKKRKLREYENGKEFKFDKELNDNENIEKERLVIKEVEKDAVPYYVIHCIDGKRLYPKEFFPNIRSGLYQKNLYVGELDGFVQCHYFGVIPKTMFQFYGILEAFCLFDVTHQVFLDHLKSIFGFKIIRGDVFRRLTDHYKIRYTYRLDQYQTLELIKCCIDDKLIDYKASKYLTTSAAEDFLDKNR